jgi:hypothetical protein
MRRALVLKLTGLALVVSVRAAPAVHATLYTFINIADNTMTEPGGSNFESFENPSISDSAVAFVGSYFGGAGIYTGSGGALTTIANRGDAAPTGTFDSFNAQVAITSGTVALIGQYDSFTKTAVFTGSGGALTTIAQSGDPAPTGTFDSVESPSISGGTVTFRGVYAAGGQEGIFSGSGGAVATVVKEGDPAPTGTFDGIDDAAISGGNVAFGGEYGGNEGIVVDSGGTKTEIFRTGDAAPIGTFDGILGSPVIDGSTVAFQASFNDGVDSGEGVFAGSGGALTTIAKTGDTAPVGTFDSFDSDAAISGGIVAFLSFYDSSNQVGIFTGSGGPLDTVIKSGDALFGSTVVDLQFGLFGLDPDGSGNLAFSYQLDDGRRGIAIASPTAVPEARAWLMLGAVCAGMIAAHLYGRRSAAVTSNL